MDLSNKQEGMENLKIIILMKKYLNYLSLVCLFIFATFSCGDPTVRDKPNILFISIDDLRPTLGAYDDTVAITPNIDRLSEEGMTFRQTFCQSAVCAPSRASLMTGLRPDSTRV